MPSILYQTIAAPMLPELFIWLIAIGTAGYLGYKVLYKKEPEFVKLVTGIPGFTLLLLMLVLATVGTDFYALFGPLAGLFEIMGNIITAVLGGVVIVMFLNFVAGIFEAERVRPGI
jgi:hypothetical protein